MAEASTVPAFDRRDRTDADSAVPTRNRVPEVLRNNGGCDVLRRAGFGLGSHRRARINSSATSRDQPGGRESGPTTNDVVRPLDRNTPRGPHSPGRTQAFDDYVQSESWPPGGYPHLVWRAILRFRALSGSIRADSWQFPPIASPALFGPRLAESAASPPAVIVCLHDIQDQTRVDSHGTGRFRAPRCQ